MSTNRRSKDYIPTEGDRMSEAEERKEYMATHENPMGIYKITLKVRGSGEMTEEHKAWSRDEAIKQCQDQWFMVGMCAQILKVEIIKEPKV